MEMFDDEVDEGRRAADRVFDTSRGSAEIVDAVASAIAGDFPKEELLPPPLPGAAALPRSGIAALVTSVTMVILITAGLATVAYFAFAALALASWGSSK